MLFVDLKLTVQDLIEGEESQLEYATKESQKNKTPLVSEVTRFKFQAFNNLKLRLR